MLYWVYNDCDSWIYDTDGVAVGYWEGDDETGKLAAAAPELLEALFAIVSAAELHGTNGPEFFGAREQALAAMTKAAYK